MSIALIILGIIAAVIIVLVVLIATRPAEFRLERTATMAATPSVVFAQVNDFRKWEPWSPWEKMDPTLKRTHSGAAEGTGAVYDWVGNPKVGQGRMTILESRPHESIRIKLEFIKPFAATNTTEFAFQPQGSQTLVTWTMIGHNNFMAKAFDLVMNMDKVVGKDFEKGLASMKTVAEAAAK